MKKINTEFQKIYYNLDKILLLFFTLFVLMEFVWIPLNSWMAEYFLSLTGYTYLTASNFLAVFTSNWLVTGGFVSLFLVNILVAYLEIALIFTGVWQLLDTKAKRLSAYIRSVQKHLFEVIKEITLSKVLFLLLYSVILLPFLRKILNIYYFKKLLIPQFIVDYLSNNLWVAILILLSLIFFFWLGSRLMYALPQIFFEHEKVKDAVLYSWEKTKGRKQISSGLRLLWITLQPSLLFLAFGLLLYGLQVLVDSALPTVAPVLVLLSFVLVKLAYYSAIALFMMKLVALLTGRNLPVYPRKSLRHGLRLSILLVSSLFFLVQGVVTFYFPFETMPLTISHRGVDDANGVQNTIEALEKTAQIAPDYVEMDVQETKDLEFVVMHDTDLTQLTGNPGGTHDYTLAELTGMMASENGMSSPVPSFDAYLNRADELGQKLLVEIKVTKQDSKELMPNFLRKYGQRLIAKGHQMQSLDYGVIQKVRAYDERLVSYFILPFNSIYPDTVANGYTMEYSSLDQDFLLRSWLKGQGVYAWTPNDEDSMTQMINLQVDGIITDQLSTMKELMKRLKDNRQYADLFILQLQSLLYRF